MRLMDDADDNNEICASAYRQAAIQWEPPWIAMISAIVFVHAFGVADAPTDDAGADFLPQRRSQAILRSGANLQTGVVGARGATDRGPHR